jgi:hypothetical protein
LDIRKKTVFKISYPKLSPIPRHIRKVPSQKSQLLAIGAKRRRSIKVFTRSDLFPFFRGQINTDEEIVVPFFANGDQIRERNMEICKTDTGLGDRFSIDIDPLVFIVDKVDFALMNGKRGAAIFMDPRPHAQIFGRHIAFFAFGRALDNDRAAIFIWTELVPIDYFSL